MVHLYLTDEGRDVVERCNEIGRRIEKEWLSSIDPDELAVFEKVLAELTAVALT